MMPLGDLMRLWRSGPQGRLWLGACVAVLAGLFATVAIAAGERNDMDIFLQASADLRAGRDPYQLRYNEWYRYFYSPAFALAMAPLAWMGAAAAKWLWGFGIIAMALRTLQVIGRWLGPEALLPRARFHALLLLMLFQPLRDNINSMQLTPLLVWLCIEAVDLARRGRPWAAGGLIALGMDAKLMPAVLLPYLIWRRQWAAASAAAGLFIALQAVPALAVGWDGLMGLHRSRAELLNPADARHILDEEEPSFISLGSLLSAYLSTEGGSSNTLALPRTIAALSLDAIAALLLAGRLALIGLTLLFVRWPPFRPEADGRRVLREAGYLLLCSILLFPHQRNYSMLLALPAVAWLLDTRLATPALPAASRLTWVLAAAAIGLNAELLLGEFAGIYAHYKLKSLIAILLIAALATVPERPRPASAP